MLADPDVDIFDGIVLDTSVLPGRAAVRRRHPGGRDLRARRRPDARRRPPPSVCPSPAPTPARSRSAPTTSSPTSFTTSCAAPGTGSRAGPEALRPPRRRPDRGAVEDVGLRDLDLVEAEGAHHLDQDHDAGDDRRRPVGMEAGVSRRSASGSAASRSNPLDRSIASRAVHALGVVGSSSWSIAAREVGVPATAIAALRRRSPRLRAPRSGRARRRPAPRAPPGRGIGAQVALGMADRAGLQRGVESTLAPADDQLRGAAADVETSVLSALADAGRGAEVGEVSLLLAPRRRASSPKRCRAQR